MSGVLHSGNEFLTGKSCERVATAVPHVDVPDKHFGVALGETRTLRTATKEHLGHRIGTSEMATREDDIPTRGAGRGRAAVIYARKTRGNRGNIGIARPPGSVCPNFAQSDVWRLALGHMVGNVKGNEGKTTGAHLGAVVVPVDDAATARPPPKAWSAGVAAVVMGATSTSRTNLAEPPAKNEEFANSFLSPFFVLF